MSSYSKKSIQNYVVWTLASLIFPLTILHPRLHAEEETNICDTKQVKENEPVIPAYLLPFSLGECGDITFKPGARIQTRYLYDNEDHNNDFFIRRFRFKASGDAFGIAKYGMELKIDNTGRYCKEAKAAVENAWVDFTLCKELVYLRIGLYDVPFSRNALTSDSKLLFMDRSLVKFALTDIGLADNTIGLLLHGRPYGGHLEYYIGIFDNEKFEKIGSSGKKYADQLMPAGRLVWNFLDPATPPNGYADYKETYLCDGRYLALGINAGYLGCAKEEFDEDDDEEDTKFDISGAGIDLYYNTGRFSFLAEYDWFNEDDPGYGWYIAAGYVIWGPIEVAARYQELKPTRNYPHDKLRWTTLGMNYYFRKHKLKIQSDYTFKREKGDSIDNDVFQIQLQFDY